MVCNSSNSGLDVGNWKPEPATATRLATPQQLKLHESNIPLPKLIDALQRIESHDYQEWINVGLALKHAGEDLFIIWKWWSERSPKSKDTDFEEKWASLKPDGRIKLGSIFHRAGVKEQPRFSTYNLEELLEGDFEVEYLIEGLLVKGQPAICCGPSKSLKTTMLLNIALCLASGRQFIGRACKQQKVLFMSGESGMATLQDTAARMIKASGAKPPCDSFYLSPNLPRLDQPLDDLEKLLIEKCVEVLIIDPAYLCMNGADANNVFAMGQQLGGIAELCTQSGVTLIMAHHTTKSAGRENKPLELTDMSWSGFGEFARQWLLLSRRKSFVDGTGDHPLYLRAGGSAGHSALLHLDVSEGVFPNRYWKLDFKTAGEANSNLKEAKYEKERQKVISALKDAPLTKTKMRDQAGINSSRWPETFDRLLKDGTIKPTSKSSRPKYCLAPGQDHDPGCGVKGNDNEAQS